MRPIRLHNTLTGSVSELVPEKPPEIRMYACGLTVYGRGHIGNFRTLLAVDILRRTLKYRGYRVVEVLNVTDVDDKIIQLAARDGATLAAFTAPHIRAFEDDMAALRLETPERVPKATEHIPEMVGLISRLIERGHTYTADGSVYFRIASFPEYGRLARLDTAGIKAGARVDTDKYDKENARDFVLWKSKSDEPEWAQWDAPFGKGRPGWHIECSAMAMKYLGETFDLHAGGVDLVFPHHENEIAQSQCGTGKPYVRHWMHVQHLLIENETMSKSKGNIFTIPELVARGHRPEAIRYLLSSAHYRTSLNFTWEGLQHAAAALERVHGFVRRLGEVDREGPAGEEARQIVEKARADFGEALADDLNTPEALAAVHDLVGRANVVLASGAATRGDAALLRGLVDEMDSVFAVLVPAAEERLSPEEQALFDERQDARKKRDFARADAARARLEALGIVLEDTPKGTRWHRKG
jgi:cysteinyl-tRNA synthetase